MSCFCLVILGVLRLLGNQVFHGEISLANYLGILMTAPACLQTCSSQPRVRWGMELLFLILCLTLIVLLICMVWHACFHMFLLYCLSQSRVRHPLSLLLVVQLSCLHLSVTVW